VKINSLGECSSDSTDDDDKSPEWPDSAGEEDEEDDQLAGQEDPGQGREMDAKVEMAIEGDFRYVIPLVNTVFAAPGPSLLLPDALSKTSKRAPQASAPPVLYGTLTLRKPRALIFMMSYVPLLELADDVKRK
jgi:hypothetical protein